MYRLAFKNIAVGRRLRCYTTNATEEGRSTVGTIALDMDARSGWILRDYDPK